MINKLKYNVFLWWESATNCILIKIMIKIEIRFIENTCLLLFGNFNSFTCCSLTDKYYCGEWFQTKSTNSYVWTIWFEIIFMNTIKKSHLLWMTVYDKLKFQQRCVESLWFRIEDFPLVRKWLIVSGAEWKVFYELCLITKWFSVRFNNAHSTSDWAIFLNLNLK